MRNAINPDTLFDAVQYGFSHAVKSEGAAMLHLAGQIAWDSECNLIGEGDLAAQARQALNNLKAVLADQGATPAIVVPVVGRTGMCRINLSVCATNCKMAQKGSFSERWVMSCNPRYVALRNKAL